MEKGGFRRLPWPLLFIILYVQNTYADVSCKAGTFSIGRPGSVTCDFGKDIRKQQINFNVVQYSFQSPSAANYLLLCNWVSSKPECTFKEGLTFSLNQEGTGLTVNITSVEANMAGTVICQLVPDDGLRATSCSLTICLGGSCASDVQRQTVSLTPENSADKNGVFLVIIVVTVILLLFCGCPAIGLLIHIWLRYTLVRRHTLAGGKKSRGWRDIGLCRLFQAGLRCIHLCLQRIDKDEAETKEMCTNTFIESHSKEVQCTKTALQDLSTNTDIEGVHLHITVHTQEGTAKALSSSLHTVTSHRPERAIAAEHSEPKNANEQAVSRSKKKSSKEKNTTNDTPIAQETQPPVHTNCVSRESNIDSLPQNTDTENSEETPAITSADTELEQTMRLRTYANEPTRRHASLDDNLDHDESNISASSVNNNESQLSETEGDVENDQERGIVTSDQPENSDARESCSADELSPLNRDENTDTTKLGRWGQFKKSFKSKLSVRL